MVVPQNYQRRTAVIHWKTHELSPLLDNPYRRVEIQQTIVYPINDYPTAAVESPEMLLLTILLVFMLHNMSSYAPTIVAQVSRKEEEQRSSPQWSQSFGCTPSDRCQYKNTCPMARSYVDLAVWSWMDAQPGRGHCWTNRAWSCSRTRSSKQ